MTNDNPILSLAAKAADFPSSASVGSISRILTSLVGIPSAFLRRPAQAIEDVTDARSAVARGIAAEVINRAINDPEIMKAAEAAYIPTNLRRIANRTAIVSIATEELSGDAGLAEPLAPNIDEDWLNSFIRYADDASSDRLQHLFAKVLAGQVKRPGTFSPSTLRFLSELTQDIAEDFTWAWSKDIGGKIWRSEDFDKGANWERVQRLREAGLMSPGDAATFTPPFNPAVSTTYAWAAASAGEYALTVVFKEPTSHRLPIAVFSKTGRELGLLLPQPDYRANMTAASAALRGPNVDKMILHLPNGEAEYLPASN